MLRPLAAVMTLAGLTVLAAGCGGSTASKPAPAAAPSPTRATATPGRLARNPTFPAAVALGLPAVPRGPVPGYVLIADRNNNRLLIVSPTGRIVWRFPQPGDVRPGQSFHDPDDAFFTPGYHRLVTLADAAATRLGTKIVLLGGAGSAESSAVLELHPS